MFGASNLEYAPHGDSTSSCHNSEISLAMSIDDMEIEIKKLIQRFEESMEEQRAKRARVAAMRKLQFDAIQNSIDHLLNIQNQSPIHQHQHTENSSPAHQIHQHLIHQQIHQIQRKSTINFQGSSIIPYQDLATSEIQQQWQQPETSSDSTTQAIHHHHSFFKISEIEIAESKFQIQQTLAMHNGGLCGSGGVHKNNYVAAAMEVSPNGVIAEEGVSATATVAAHKTATEAKQRSTMTGKEVAHSGPEDGALAMGEGRFDTLEITTNPHVLAAAISGGDLRRGGYRRISPILARPPELLAALFPWNRENEARKGKSPGMAVVAQEEVEASRVAGDDAVKNHGLGAVIGFTSSHRGAVVGAWPLEVEGTAGTRKEKVWVWVRFFGSDWGLLLGLKQIAEAQSEEKEESIIYRSNLKLEALFGQLQIFATSYFCLILIDGPKFYKWDPGGIFIFL